MLTCLRLWHTLEGWSSTLEGTAGSKMMKPKSIEPKKFCQRLMSCLTDGVPPKMNSCTADLYPIENVWSILKAEVSKKQPILDVKQLKKIITHKWREMNRDKDLMKRKIGSVPRRVEAMLKLKGDQVHKFRLCQL